MRYIEQFTRQAAQAGVSAVDFHIEEINKKSVEIFMGEPDTVTASSETLICIQGNVEGKLGTAFTEDMNEAEIPQLIDAILQSAAQGSTAYKALDISTAADGEKPSSGADLEKVIPQLLAAEKAMYAAEPGLAAASLRFSTFNKTVKIATAKGVVQNSYGTCSVGGRAVVRNDGETQTSHMGYISDSMFDFEPIAVKAAKDAAGLIGAAPCQSGKYPVIFKNSVFGQILEAYMPVFFGQKVQDGTSLLAGKTGAVVAASGVSLSEVPDALIFRSFDDQATPACRRDIIKDGVLNGYLHNIATAQKAGVAPTGNGFRPRYQSAVTTGYTNIIMDSSRKMPMDTLLCEMGDGVLITECDGIFAGVNPTSGAFSLISKGWLVRDGKPQKPVNQITVGGNFFDLLRDIVATGDDARYIGNPASGLVKAASTWIRELTVSGK